MSAFSELDALLQLEQDTLDYEETAAACAEIYEQFTESDIADLQRLWRSRPLGWLKNLGESLDNLPRLCDPEFTLRAFWPLAWDMIGSDSDESILIGLRLLVASSVRCERRGRNYTFSNRVSISDVQLSTLAEVWISRPDLRNAIKNTCITAERAAHLRSILHLDSWSDAEERYPSTREDRGGQSITPRPAPDPHTA